MASRMLAAMSRHLGRVGPLRLSAGRPMFRQTQWRAVAAAKNSNWTGAAEVHSSHAVNNGEEATTSPADAGRLGQGLSFSTLTSMMGPSDTFPHRHIGPEAKDIPEMLKVLDPPARSLQEFVEQVIPPDILSSRPLFQKQRQVAPRDEGDEPTDLEHLYAVLGENPTESTVKRGLDEIASQNTLVPTFIGMGYHGTLTPEVIKLNLIENTAWYTSYTPYQPEISQGRLESLLNFQTMVSDLTALPISNASLLDEATAAAEAMTLSLNSLSSSRAKSPSKTYIVSDRLHPRTVEVMRGRAEGFGVAIEAMPVPSDAFLQRVESLGNDLVGVMVQYPDTFGEVTDYSKVAQRVHEAGCLLSCATDLLALTMLKPPGEWGADIAFGSAQRLGVPMFFGGPHAAFFAVAEKHKRKMPGRLVGVSKDRLGGRALRLALQTREQHIRREKATSNVCTAQALLANVSAMYAVYHGPQGLRAIAEEIKRKADFLRLVAGELGFETSGGVAAEAGSGDEAGLTPAWDTVRVRMPGWDAKKVLTLTKDPAEPLSWGLAFNPRLIDDEWVGFTVDEATTPEDLLLVRDALVDWAWYAHPGEEDTVPSMQRALDDLDPAAFTSASATSTIPQHLRRTSEYLKHPVFNSHHSETELMRYMHHLQSKDLSLVHSMIPLGSCTMKLNGAVEMSALTDPRLASIHPLAPEDQTAGYKTLITDLKLQLQDITAMDAVSLQPNSGAQGEFAGLRAIRLFHQAKGDDKRDICLIPVSAHGTNPASAAMAGMRVVPVKCDAKTGNLDVEDLEAKCAKHSAELGAIMVTYPSTFGVFEPAIKKVCEVVHQYGGQVYMDGANMNAQIGLCSPGEIGADVCHLNLHKTFCIPHGGGGPGAGPICVKEHLAPFLPDPEQEGGVASEGYSSKNPVSAARYGSAGILTIPWAYNTLMGAAGLKRATEMTLLNANYILARLRPHYSVLYTNEHGRCAHEFILDARPFRDSAGVEAIDIAKRLQDYGFHAPTMSWPVPNTLMIEPTESESKEELDRFVDALVSIRGEIREVEEGRQPREGNVLKMAPHPVHDIIGGDGEGGARWDRPYSREKAAYPLPWLREKKFWPSVARVDDAYGDINLFCTCPPVEDTTGGVDISSVQTSETK